MITKNFETFAASILVSSSSYTYGFGQIFDVSNAPFFINGHYSTYNMPSGTDGTLTTDKYAAGISIGTGDSPESKYSNNLDSTITSGVTLTLTSTKAKKNGQYRVLEFTITITNTGSEQLVIKEVGYKQIVGAGRYIGDAALSSTAAVVFLVDRTVLTTPLTIQAGDAGILKYAIQFTETFNQKNGIDLIPFSIASDQQIAAMIDAARNGLINLQTDAGWRVGDMRPIDLTEFTANDVTYPAQTLDIIITEFGDYNNCGSLFQFDFVEGLNQSSATKLNNSATNLGGYASTLAYTTILPAMVEALPEWLKTRLKTFSVLASAGGQSTEIETIPNNKLALRSAYELLGRTSGNSSTVSGEGSYIEFYKISLGNDTNYTYCKTSANNRGFKTVAGRINAWTRSPLSNGSASFAFIASGTTYSSQPYGATANNTSSAKYISPFGCI